MDVPREKLIIIDQGAVRQAVSRARLLATGTGLYAPDHADLSAVGSKLIDELKTADGVELVGISRHAVQFRTIHMELWSWDEVETTVIAAFGAALGCELDIIHENK